MKASRSITLTLIAAVSVTSLAACDEGPMIRKPREPIPPSAEKVDPGAEQLFTDASSCAAQADPAHCAEGFEQAKEEHSRTAPRFPDKAACEATGTGCVEDPAAPGLFLPVMAGFMLSRLLSGPSVRSTPLYAGPNPDCRANPQAPACRSGGGGGGGSATSYYYAGRGYYGSAPSAGFTSGGYVPLARSPSAPPAFSTSSLGRTPSVSTISRGGFGASASAHGSAGS